MKSIFLFSVFYYYARFLKASKVRWTLDEFISEKCSVEKHFKLKGRTDFLYAISKWVE